MSEALDILAVAITSFVVTLIVGFGLVALVILVGLAWKVLLLFAGIMLTFWAFQRVVDMDNRRYREQA